MTEHNPSFFERLNSQAKSSISVKLFSIGILILILLIPVSMVTALIAEREYTSMNAMEEVSSKWSGQQTLSGPVLTVPYKKYYTKNNQLVETIEYAHFLPDQLNISAEVAPEKRQRGIYEVVVYTSKVRVTGNFLQPSFAAWNINPQDVIFSQAFMSMGISDMRGIREKIVMELTYPGGKTMLDLQPGMAHSSLRSTQEDAYRNSGVSAKLALPDIVPSGTRYNFSFDIDMNGSGKLYFVPVGNETMVDMTSSWNNPSFDGAFLPDSHEITESGFKAYWKVLQLNRTFPQQWLDEAYDTDASSFGVSLIMPVDHYQKSLRAAKYAILVIGLTFLVFFFVEIFSKRRIHPFQYILVGLALCLFYSLLISLSEHIHFNLAYLISAAAVITAITAYASSVFKDRSKALLLGLILILTYTFMYMLIQLQDYALLTGSIGLFAVLSTVMYVSRKIEWYET